MLNEMAKQWQSVAFGHGKRLLRSREAIGKQWFVLKRAYVKFDKKLESD